MPVQLRTVLQNMAQWLLAAPHRNGSL